MGTGIVYRGSHERGFESLSRPGKARQNGCKIWQVGLTRARAAKIASMPTDASSRTANEAFFQPILGLAEASKHTRPCPELCDELWIRAGILRVRKEVASGRGFLHRQGGPQPWPVRPGGPCRWCC